MLVVIISQKCKGHREGGLAPYHQKRQGGNGLMIYHTGDFVKRKIRPFDNGEKSELPAILRQLALPDWPTR